MTLQENKMGYLKSSAPLYQLKASAIRADASLRCVESNAELGNLGKKHAADAQNDLGVPLKQQR